MSVGRRVVAALLVVTGGLLTTATPVAVAQEEDGLTPGPEGFDPSDWDETAGPETTPWEGSPTVEPQLPEEDSFRPTEEPEFPAADEFEATLREPGANARTTGRRSRSPLTIRAADGAADGTELTVNVLDRDAAAAAGVSGFVFTVEDQSDDDAVPLQMEIDYSDFADAFGGDYRHRLKVVALPPCALEDPVPAGCDTAGTEVPATNLGEDERMVVDVADLGALVEEDAAATDALEAAAESLAAAPSDGQADIDAERDAARPEYSELPAALDPWASGDDATDPSPEPGADRRRPPGREGRTAASSGVAVLALTAGIDGPGGTYAASQLSLSGSWSVSPGSGEFTYSYPMALPAPPAGSAPTVGVSYSSGAIDGMTLASNTQASMNGVGWSDFANASISKSFEPCFMYGVGVVESMPDFCFEGFSNSTLTLGPVSGILVPIDANFREFRLKDDPGWRIERQGDVNPTGDNQRWKVTGPDGTQYFFGLHTDPDTAEATWSRLWVPVVSDEAGEPCWDAVQNKASWCNMTYRWMLDRVVDPDGNLTAYFYSRETNRYNFVGGALAFEGKDPSLPYVRSVALARIDYGRRVGTNLQASARVSFGLQARCQYLDSRYQDGNGDGTPDRNGSNCPRATKDNGNIFFDVPNDAICSTANCAQVAPSFFTDRRYAHALTEVRFGPGVDDWRPVTQYNLNHGIGLSGGSKLYLNSIQHAAVSQGGLSIYPDTTFSHTGGLLDNRVDWESADPSTKLPHYRITKVTNPFGATTEVTYGHQRECARTYALDKWHVNDRDCFPQTIRNKDNFFVTGVFHKWLVTQIVETPRFGAGNPGNGVMTTSYAYGDTPAWGYDHGAFARGDSWLGWSSWRGYGTTTIATDSSTTRIRNFRGLHTDAWLAVENGHEIIDWDGRTASVANFDGSYSSEDWPWLAGRTLEEAALSQMTLSTPEGGPGKPSIPLLATQYRYESRETATPLPGHERDTPRWVGVTDTIETTSRLTTFGHNGWETETRQRGTTTSYDANRQPWRTVERGWLDDPDDDRCSITEYAVNPTLGMVNYPKTNTIRAGDACTSGTILRYSETYYDNSTDLHAAPTRGNVTMTRSQVDGSRFAVTTLKYDAQGRPTEVVDPLGSRTTTTYTASPSHVIPTKTVVTTFGDPAVTTDDRTITTELIPEFSLPTKVTDANGNVTTYKYDVFGRSEWVRSPTEQTTGEPTYRFAYFVDFDDPADPDNLPELPTRVRTRQLQTYNGTTPVLEESWVLYDGLLRERQTQAPSPAPGRVLASSTSYNSRGEVHDAIEPEDVPGTLGSGLLVPPNSAMWANRTRYGYDELGRQVTSTWLAGSEERHSTTTEYGIDTVSVTGPDGVATRNTLDGLGRTTRVEERDGVAWVGTAYTYDLTDALRTVTDPAGNVTSYSYNMAGWKLTETDLDRGAARYEHDIAGNVTMVEDAAGQQIHTRYDALGRPTARTAGSPAGTPLVSWTYDTLKRGMPTSSTRHTPEGDWVTAVTGYDAQNRATGNRLTVPAGIPGLSGTYTTSQGYDRAGRPTTVGYPAIGGLAEETVTTAYNGWGLPATLKGTDEYVWSNGYDGRRRPTWTIVGPKNPANGFNIGLAHTLEFNADQQVARSSTFVEGAAFPEELVADRRPTYRDDGLVVARDSTQSGQAWRECYGYDARARLTSTYTVDAGEDCTEANKGGGSQPFERSYTYSADGNLLERVEDGTPTTYAYPTAPGSPRPHAPTAVGTESYTWNPDGSLAQRSGPGGSETFNWDVEHKLQSVAGPEGTTDFVYDASGNRLLRRTLQGTTLYLADQEVTVSPTGAPISAVRSYRYGGRLVATRTPAGVDYVVTDEMGSAEMTVAAGGTAAAGARRYDPYGQVRQQEGESFDTDQGFLGQTEDDSTGLSYLNARYYDAEAGIFISSDPMFDTSKPKSLNPYQYGLNNPVTFSDPSGLMSGREWGLSYENNQLRSQIRLLEGVVKQMGAHIESLQDIIKEQQRYINDLLGVVAAMDAIIRQQQTVIVQLAARVVYLENQVAYWKARAYYWQRQAMYWRGQAMYWKGQAMYWRGQAFYWRGQAMHWRGVATLQGIYIGELEGEIDKKTSAIAGWKEENKALGNENERLRDAYENLKDATHYGWDSFAEDLACGVGGSVPYAGTAIGAGCTIDDIVTGVLGNYGIYIQPMDKWQFAAEAYLYFKNDLPGDVIDMGQDVLDEVSSICVAGFSPVPGTDC